MLICVSAWVACPSACAELETSYVVVEMSCSRDECAERLMFVL